MPELPTLDELAADPSRAFGLSSTEIAALLARCAAEAAKLFAVQNALAAALATCNETPAADSLLTVEQAAERLAMKPDYLYRNSDGFPFTVRLTPGQLRFSAAGLERFIRERMVKPS